MVQKKTSTFYRELAEDIVKLQMMEGKVPISDYTLIPPAIMAGLNRYVTHGTPCGDYLTAVLSNDLFGAFKRADENNISAMFHLVSYIYNEVPGNCHGSREIVEDWIATKNPQPETCVTCHNPDKGKDEEAACESWRPGGPICKNFMDNPTFG